MEFTRADPPLSDSDLAFFKRFVFPQQELTEEQLGPFADFKARVNDIETDDTTLKRFFRTRDCNPAAAEEMLRKERKWRFSPEFPTRCSNETLLRNLLYKTVEILPHVRDRYGRPLVLVTGRCYNPSLNNHDMEKMAEYFIWGMELLKRIVRAPQSHYVLIFDLEGWGMKSFDARLPQALISVSRPYFPDHMGQTFIINYPWVVWGVWKIASMLMEKNTKEKVQFLSKSDYLKLFPMLFEKEKLYERLGGTCKETPFEGTNRDEWNRSVIAKWAEMKSAGDPEAAFQKELESHWKEFPEQEEFWKPLQSVENMDRLLSLA